MDSTEQIQFEVVPEFVIENIDTVRELMIMCKEHGLTHFEYGHLVMQFARPEDEDEGEGTIGFSSATTTIESNNDDDDDDGEDLSRDPYAKLFKGKKPAFRRPPVATEG